MATALQRLLPELRACRHCEPALPLGARSIFQLDRRAPILVASQAPGRITHAKGRPFDDVSGDRLRQWLGVSRETFYDPACFAILPMGCASRAAARPATCRRGRNARRCGAAACSTRCRMCG